ncbi:polymer-forming cytoskeletal protein [Patescibacteria group bacterium]|nr:polymer-forming cytoskeletal protein [Patescibacteria group bacterium]
MFKKKKYYLLFFSILLVLMLPLVVFADSNTGENVYLPSTETHEGNYYAAGSAVEIAGTVNGDVFAAGSSIVISGTVNGDVFAAGSSIIINGEVDGNVRVAGSTITLNGKVSRNVMAAGSSIVISESAEVARHVTLAGATVEVRGKIGGNLEASADMVNIDNEVGGDAYIKTQDEKINLRSAAKIKGDLNYTSLKQITIEDEAKVDGQVNHKPWEVKKKAAGLMGLFGLGYIMIKLIQLFGLFIVALVIIKLLPRQVVKVTDLMINKPWPQIGRGLAWFFLAPIILFIIAITVIGVYLALIGGALYLIMLFIAKVFAGIALGLIITKLFKWDKASLFLSMIIGIIVLVVIKSIPLLGWLIGLVAMWWALGAILALVKENLKGQNN